MAWVARLAVRRVVWIVVGLVVFAAFGAAGVKAAETTVPFTTGSQDCPSASACFLITVAGGAGPVSASFAGSWSGGTSYTLVIECAGGPFTASTTANNPASVSGTCTGDGTINLYVYQADGWRSSNIVSGGLTYTTVAEPTPTPTPGPTPTPTPAPDLTVVELSADDRARLDKQFDASVYGFGLVIALGTAVALSVGLRRN